jgi:hypothetical protein
MSYLASPFDKWLANPNHRGLHHSLFVIAAYSLEEGWSGEEIFDMLRKACDGVEDRPVRTVKFVVPLIMLTSELQGTPRLGRSGPRRIAYFALKYCSCIR